MCDDNALPTNYYIYIDNGTRCTGQPHKNFEFHGWLENPPSNPKANATLPIDEPSGILTVSRYGTFAANFEPLPPAIPPEYLFLVISVIVSSIIGYSIPSIFGWVKARTQLKHLEECINQIGKLDKNAIEDKINRYYVHGKISEDHPQYLKDKISEYYENVEGPEGSPL